jgi:hypothetical protein
MSKAVKSVKKAVSGDLLKNVVTGGMYGLAYKPVKEGAKGSMNMINAATGNLPNTGNLPKVDAALGVGSAKEDKPIVAPVLDDEEVMRAKQKELMRRTGAGRASTVLSGGGSSLG